MSEQPIDNTVSNSGEAPATPEDAAAGVRGGDMDRMDAEPGTTSGADGDTAARESLRKDLGERAPGADQETGQPWTPGEQATP